MKKIVLKLYIYRDKISYAAIMMTLACGIAAKLFPEDSATNNLFDALEIFFFLCATASCWWYISR